MLSKYEDRDIPEESIKNIAKSVLQGLSILHKTGFMHRDIKIENILLGKDNKYKICDFGSCTTEEIDFGKISKTEYESVKESI
jgi:serine/threonine protein kinase